LQYLTVPTVLNNFLDTIVCLCNKIKYGAEASSEFTSLLTENEILKASLDQLASEKASLTNQLRAAQDQTAIRVQEESQAAANFQVSAP
jgi:dynactin complex subunit